MGILMVRDIYSGAGHLGNCIFAGVPDVSVAYEMYVLAAG